jgi:hypothetical protein
MSKHYIAMAGIHGCIPQYCASFDTIRDAADELASIHELGKNRKRALQRDNYMDGWNWDSISIDAVVQVVLFGEVIYG